MKPSSSAAILNFYIVSKSSGEEELLRLNFWGRQSSRFVQGAAGFPGVGQT